CRGHQAGSCRRLLGQRHAVGAWREARCRDPSLAAAIGERLIPPEEAPLIGTLIERDAPFYDATISFEAIDGLNKFTTAAGLISETVPYDRLVATQFRQLWR